MYTPKTEKQDVRGGMTDVLQGVTKALLDGQYRQLSRLVRLLKIPRHSEGEARGNPVDRSMHQFGSPKIDGIATPVCALVRNDAFFFCLVLLKLTVLPKGEDRSCRIPSKWKILYWKSVSIYVILIMGHPANDPRETSPAHLGRRFMDKSVRKVSNWKTIPSIS